MNGNIVALAVATHGTWMRVSLKINGKTQYLCRAVDQDGNVLDMRVAEPTQHTRGETLVSEAARMDSNTCHACLSPIR
jgi:transposase-like protein